MRILKENCGKIEAILRKFPVNFGDITILRKIFRKSSPNLEKF